MMKSCLPSSQKSEKSPGVSCFACDSSPGLIPIRQGRAGTPWRLSQAIPMKRSWQTQGVQPWPIPTTFASARSVAHANPLAGCIVRQSVRAAPSNGTGSCIERMADHDNKMTASTRGTGKYWSAMSGEIDTKFNFYTDTPAGKDPDAHSFATGTTALTGYGLSSNVEPSLCCATLLLTASARNAIDKPAPLTYLPCTNSYTGGLCRRKRVCRSGVAVLTSEPE